MEKGSYSVRPGGGAKPGASERKYVSMLKDATVFYTDKLLDEKRADELFRIFSTSFPFKYDTYNGSPLRRQTCAFYGPEMAGSLDRIPAIWGDDVATVPFTEELLEVKRAAERQIYEWTKTKWNYDLSLGNEYLSGEDIIGEHSDREEYGNRKSIASLTYGVSRSFLWRNKHDKTDRPQPVVLKHNSLLFMGENCQESYTHRMVEENLFKINSRDVVAKFDGRRINLTFRIFSSATQESEYLIA